MTASMKVASANEFKGIQADGLAQQFQALNKSERNGTNSCHTNN